MLVLSCVKWKLVSFEKGQRVHYRISCHPNVFSTVPTVQWHCAVTSGTSLRWNITERLQLILKLKSLQMLKFWLLENFSVILLNVFVIILRVKFKILRKVLAFSQNKQFFQRKHIFNFFHLFNIFSLNITN